MSAEKHYGREVADRTNWVRLERSDRPEREGKSLAELLTVQEPLPASIKSAVCPDDRENLARRGTGTVRTVI